MCNKINAHLEKLVFTSFFCVLRAKFSDVKPWMLFKEVEPYTTKNIEHMDDIGTVHCVFDNCRTLGVIPDVDDFHIVSEDSEQTEDEGMNISM